jgi:hypothetical protein
MTVQEFLALALKHTRSNQIFGVGTIQPSASKNKAVTMCSLEHHPQDFDVTVDGIGSQFSYR